MGIIGDVLKFRLEKISLDPDAQGVQTHMSNTVIENNVDFEELQLEVANLIVETLVLEDVIASEIDFKAPLFGDGLSLDSIDALELAFAIGETYGFKLRSDDENNQEIFSCVQSLAKHIGENRVI